MFDNHIVFMFACVCPVKVLTGNLLVIFSYVVYSWILIIVFKDYTVLDFDLLDYEFSGLD